MACGKPSGDPEAIACAADAILRYADGIECVFAAIEGTSQARSTTVDLSAFWRGASATSSAATMTQYRVQLDGYAEELREYAQSLQQYAEKLAQSQKCTIWQILTWVFIVVFAIVEIVVGIFFGGTIEGMFTALLGALIDTIIDAVSTVGTVIGEVLEMAIPFSRIATNIVEAGSEAADVFGELAAPAFEESAMGAFEGVGGTLGDVAATAGADLGADALTSGAEEGFAAAVGPELADLGDAVATRVVEFVLDAPRALTEQISTYIWKAVYNTAEWYFQELVIRGLNSLNPGSGGFAAQWHGEDEKAEVLSLLGGMVIGSVGYAVSKTFFEGLNLGLKAVGLDVTAGLDSIFRSATAVSSKDVDLGTLVKHAAGTEVVTDMLDDVLENIWDYGAILAVYPAIRDEKFDWKELWWYVTYGIVEGILHAPFKHLAEGVTKKYIGDLFPGSENILKKDHPVLSEAAKDLGDFLVADGLSMLRKVTLDPIAGIGSYYEYLHGELELDGGELEDLDLDPAGLAGAVQTGSP